MEGTIQYPRSSSYSNNQRCTWHISLPSSAKIIEIEVAALSIEYDNICAYDSLKVKDNISASIYSTAF